MDRQRIWLGLGLAAALAAGAAQAAAPPTWVTDQRALLRSPDPKLAANKRLVFDMWRAIIQGAHTELAPRYFTPGYIQHNPNVGTGRDAMVAYMRQTRPVKPIQPDIAFPIVAMIAEGDKVMIATVSYLPDPAAPDRPFGVGDPLL